MAEATTAMKTSRTAETPVARTNQNAMRIPSINKITSVAEKRPQYIVYPADVMARALLGERYEKMPRQLRRPKYLGGKHLYDYAALIRRLHYADTTLRNANARLPPRLERILSAYRNALILLLDHGQYSAVKHYNPRIYSANYWNQVLEFDSYGEKEKTRIATTPPKESKDQSEQRLQDSILAYQRMAFWLRHGSACPECWTETPSGEWNTIAEAACIYKIARENPTAPRDEKNDEIIKQITNTCLRIGISPTVFLDDLVHFREVGLPQRGLSNATNGMQFSQVAFVLHTDYRTAEFIVEYGAQEELQALRRGIKARVELYFEQFDEKLENWTKWVAYESIQNIWGSQKSKEQNKDSGRGPEQIKEKLREERKLKEEARNNAESPRPELPQKDWKAAQRSQKKHQTAEMKRAAVEKKAVAKAPADRASTPSLTKKLISKFKEIQYRPWNSSHVVERSRYDFKDEYNCPQFSNHLQSPPCYVAEEVKGDAKERE